MAVLTNAILVIGFCLGAVGAAGFGEPVAGNGWLYFGVGMGVVLLGGYLHRSAKRQRAHGHGGEESAVSVFRRQVEGVRDIVAEIDDQKGSRPPEETRDRIDMLLRSEFFDLTSRNEDWIQILGFSGYARIWDGVAGAERLLARAWSMATDGSHEEGWEELPIARTQIERAAAEAAKVHEGVEIFGEPDHPGI